MSIENMVSATVRRGERVQPRGVIPFYRKHLRARLFNSLLLSRGARFLYNFLLHTHTPISYSLLDYFSQSVICAYAVCPFVCDLLRANGCLCVPCALSDTICTLDCTMHTAISSSHVDGAKRVLFC